MSLIIAAIVLSPMIEGGNAAAGQGAQTVTVAATVDNAGTNAAQQWVALVDRERWGESWQTAGSLFNTQMSAEKWASTAVEVRRPLGPVVSRTLQTATKTSSLPGAPAGEYEVLEFATNFTNKPAAIETVIVVREVTGWKVAGYFVR